MLRKTHDAAQSTESWSSRTLHAKARCLACQTLWRKAAVSAELRARGSKWRCEGLRGRRQTQAAPSVWRDLGRRAAGGVRRWAGALPALRDTGGGHGEAGVCAPYRLKVDTKRADLVVVSVDDNDQGGGRRAGSTIADHACAITPPRLNAERPACAPHWFRSLAARFVARSGAMPACPARHPFWSQRTRMRSAQTLPTHGRRPGADEARHASLRHESIHHRCAS